MFQQNRVFAPETKTAGRGDGSSCNESGTLEPVIEGEHHLVLEYKIGGPLTYVTASAHCKRFLDLAVDRVLINLSHVTRIDHDGIAALEVKMDSYLICVLKPLAMSLTNTEKSLTIFK
jgi:MFS superfamily sulfate permease-like transporter